MEGESEIKSEIENEIKSEIKIKNEIKKLYKKIEALELSLLKRNEKLKPITDNEIKENVEKLRRSNVCDGIAGLSKFITDCYKNKIVCKNSEKKMFYYKDENENIVCDYRLNILLTKIFSSIRSKSIEIIDGYIQFNFSHEICSKKNEKEKHKLQTIKLNIIRIADGLDSPFKTKLIGAIMNLLNL